MPAKVRTMNAFVLTRYGGPEAAEFRQIPLPEPKRGEIRIRVRAAGLNPVDFKIRKGMLAILVKYGFPIVLGNELSGTVDAIGEGARRFVLGDEVFARVEKVTMGAFAEYACVPERLVARKPRSLDFAQAAVVPLAGLTALQVLRDELHAAMGQRLFIPGGAGGVGTFAIQLARHFGAEVTTTASPRGKQLVTRLGANRVVDYTESALPKDLGEHDAAFDLIGGASLSRAFQVVRRGGRVVSIAGMLEPKTITKDLGLGLGFAALFWLLSFPTRFRAWLRGQTYRCYLMHPDGGDLAQLAAFVDANVLEVVVDRVFLFSQIAEAFAYLELGHAKGKVVVEVSR